MKLKFYCVHDSKVGAYMAPFTMRSNAEAIRGFEEVCQDTKTNISKWPADYTLFSIGEFDDETGTLTTHTLTNLGNGVDYIKKPSNIQEYMQTKSALVNEQSLVQN